MLRLVFVGQVGNLRRIANPPAATNATMWGRLATCGRLAIGLPRATANLSAPTACLFADRRYVGQAILATAAFQAAFAHMPAKIRRQPGLVAPQPA